MNEIRCKFCQKVFVQLRSDMQYCQSTCRHNYRNRVKLQKNNLVKKEQDLKEFRAKLAQAKTELEKYNQEKAAFEKESKKQTALEDKLKKSYEQLLKLPEIELYTMLWKKEIKALKGEASSLELFNMKVMYQCNDAQIIKEIIAEFKAKKQKAFNSIESKQFTRFFKYPILVKDPKLEDIEKRIEILEQEITTLEQTEIKLDLPTGSANKQKKQSRKEQLKEFEVIRNKIPSKELSGGQVVNMNFNTYTLSGELGRFLGELDDNMVAFALTGDSGAGKSYFSFELAKLFLDSGKSVKYYSLEEGIGKLTKDKLLHYQIGNELKITANGTIEDVEKDAKKYDVIIVDSFSKLTNDQKEFDWLRHNHPKTLFIIIFQKTTAKTMKGGAGIKYDSSAMIDVKKQDGERIAFMEKGRYGTDGWIYSIDQGRIIFKG